MTDPSDPAEHPAEHPTEHVGEPPGEPAAELGTAPGETPPRPRRDPLPVLFGIGVIVLIGAVIFLWRHPLNLASFSSQPSAAQTASAPPAPAPPPTSPPSASDGTGSQAAATPAPPPPAPDAAATPPPAPPPATVASAPPPAPTPAPAPAPAPMPVSPGGPTAEQLAALEQRIDKLQQQVDQLSQKAPPTVDLGPLDKRLTALENRPVPAPPPNLAPAIAALSGKVDELAAKQTSDQGALDAKIGAVGKQTDTLAATLAQRAGRIARIQAAAVALSAGQPLGDLPDAPPPLAKFSAAPPPTEASLRLAFPAAVKAAEAAGEPDTGKMPFWQAVQNRAESLVTVRRGDEVLVGDSTAGVIARARTALDAGDLAGAVAALGSLTGPPAQAMAPWVAQAKSLLEARAALAAMAAHA